MRPLRKDEPPGAVVYVKGVIGVTSGRPFGLDGFPRVRVRKLGTVYAHDCNVFETPIEVVEAIELTTGKSISE